MFHALNKDCQSHGSNFPITGYNEKRFSTAVARVACLLTVRALRECTTSCNLEITFNLTIMTVTLIIDVG